MKRFLSTTMILFVLLTNIFAQELNLSKPIAIDSRVKIGKLDNGLTYYIRKNSKPEKRVELRLVTNAGSMQEDEKQVGLAHFTEHMAFNGSENFPKNELVSYLQSIGMRFGGDLNAYTSFDETVYMLTIPTDNEEQVHKGFLVLKDWASGLTMDGKAIDAERGVIIEEYRGGLGADDRMRKIWFPIAFNGSRYANRLPIGTLENLKSFKHEELRRFYKTWYRPNLQAIVVVGDIDVEAVEAQIKELFGSLKNPDNCPEKIMYPIADNKEPLIAIATDKEATSQMVMTFRKHPNKKMITLEDLRNGFMRTLFNMMFDARLNELSQDTACPYLSASSGMGDFVGNVDAYSSYAASKENRMGEAFTILMREEERVKQYGFLATELERAKDEYLSLLEKSANEVNKTNSANFASQYVSNFLRQSEISGAKYRLSQAKKMFAGITAEEVSAFAKEWITDNNFVVVVLAPETEGLKVLTEKEIRDILAKKEYKNVGPYIDKFKDEPLIDKELPGGKIVNTTLLQPLDAKLYTLSNGVQVVVKSTTLKDDEILLTAKSVGGSSLLPVEDMSSATFATMVMESSGLGNFDNIELEKKLKGKVVSISPYISDIEEGFSGSTTPKDVETLLQLIYLYFDAPRFDSAKFNITINALKTQIKMFANSPQIIFLDTLMKMATQNDPRQVRIPSEDYINQASLERMKVIYADRFANAGDFVFTFVGNIDEATFLPLVEKYLGSLPNINRKENYVDNNKPFPDQNSSSVVKAGVENQGAFAVMFNEPIANLDFQTKAAINIFSEIVDIKTIEVIREKMGGTYSPVIEMNYTSLPKKELTTMVYINCAPKNIKKLKKATFKIFKDLINNGIDSVSFNKAVEQIKKGREKSVQENRFWCSHIANILFENLPLDNRLQMDKVYQNITIAQVQEIMKKLWNNDHYVAVDLYPEGKSKKK